MGVADDADDVEDVDVGVGIPTPTDVIQVPTKVFALPSFQVDWNCLMDMLECSLNMLQITEQYRKKFPMEWSMTIGYHSNSKNLKGFSTTPHNCVNG